MINLRRPTDALEEFIRWRNGPIIRVREPYIIHIIILVVFIRIPRNIHKS